MWLIKKQSGSQQEQQKPKSKKKMFLLGGLALLSLVSVFYILTSSRQTKNPSNSTPTENPVNTLPSRANTDIPAEGGYFINQISNTNTPVTGYGWIDEKLFYSTPRGIYSADSKEVVVSAFITAIEWSRSGYAVYKSGDKWSLFNGKTGSSNTIPVSDDKFFLNPEGNSAISFNGSSVKLLNIPSGSPTSQTNLTGPVNAVWSSDGQTIAISQATNTGTDISVFDNSLKLIKTLKLGVQRNLLNVSPKGDILLLGYKGVLYLYSIQKQDSQKIEFKAGSVLKGTYLSDDLIFIIETYKDQIGRSVDNFWALKSNGQISLMANSNPIPRKVNTNMNLFANEGFSVIPVAENDGSLWLVSLVQNVAPIYNQNGLNYQPIPTNIYKDKGV